MKIFRIITLVHNILITQRAAPLFISIEGNTPWFQLATARFLGSLLSRAGISTHVPESINTQDLPPVFDLNSVFITLEVDKHKISGIGALILTIKISRIPAIILKVLNWFNLFQAQLSYNELRDLGIAETK